MPVKYWLMKCADGGVEIMQTIQRADGSYPAPQECIAKLAAPKEYDEIAEIEPGDIPHDRTFRNAWGHDLEVRMPEARNIWRNRMRRARKPKLEALDVEHMSAMGKRDNKVTDEIERRKQALRDVTADPAIEAAQTPEELKTVWPSELQ